MKKIFLLFAAVCALVACDPVHEDISNAGHITVDELIAKTTVSVDKAASGQNGNVVTCSTSAPVNAKWTIAGKDFVGNYAWKKMKLGDYTVVMTAVCADGTELTANFPISCQEITNPLEKYVLWEGEFTVGGWDAAPLRFSDSEGQNFPTLTDDFYFGLKTLILDVKEASEGCTARVMNGWWSSTYADNIPLTSGMKWEVPITEQIAKECAKGNGGEGRDLNLLITNGSATFTSVYYEE
jgi:hypothetical protein